MTIVPGVIYWVYFRLTGDVLDTTSQLLGKWQSTDYTDAHFLSVLYPFHVALIWQFCDYMYTCNTEFTCMYEHYNIREQNNLVPTVV